MVSRVIFAYTKYFEAIMSDWHCQVCVIEKMVKHPNADNLSIATVMGDYPVVTKTGQYNVGDKIGYIAIDSIVPDVEAYYFLCPKAYEQYEEDGEVKQRQTGPKFPVGSVPEKYRIIKAKRIRNVYSMGMLVDAPEGLNVGDSIVEVLGLTKWAEIEDDNIPRATKMKGGNAAKAPEGWSIPYYDIEGARKYFSCLNEGEEIVVSEKVHGCLHKNTQIRMADGSLKFINKINVGDEVIGYYHGYMKASKVLNVFNNGASKDANWLKIKTTRSKMGRGGNEGVITCTDQHRFYDFKTKEYKRAYELKVGDDITFLRNDYNLTPIHKQIILGKLLGDAHLQLSNNSAYIKYGHVYKDYDYLKWCKRALGSLSKDYEYKRTSGYGSSMVDTGTISSIFIKNHFESMINNRGRKIVPKWVVDEMTPLSLAFWYMDDGSLVHHQDQQDRASFAVCNFDKKDCGILLKALKKFNIVGTFHQTSNKNKNIKHSRIRLNSDEAEKFFLLIAPYIPKCMQRKLPERYRGHEGWLPPQESVPYKDPLVQQEIKSIEKIDGSKFVRWDIETETSNYFARNMLVHNSNASYCYDGEKLWQKSRNFYKKPDPDDPWVDIAIRYNLEEKLSKYPGLAFFGEMIGLQKGFRYDCEIIDSKLYTKIKFFDIYDTKAHRYLDYDDFVRITDELELERCPELYRGPLISKEEVYAYAEGKSMLNDKHIREGIVIKTVKERYEPKLDSRMMIKLIGEGYSLQK